MPSRLALVLGRKAGIFYGSPFVWQGYNCYADAALELGTLKDSNIHSAMAPIPAYSHRIYKRRAFWRNGSLPFS